MGKKNKGTKGINNESKWKKKENGGERKKEKRKKEN